MECSYSCITSNHRANLLLFILKFNNTTLHKQTNNTVESRLRTDCLVLFKKIIWNVNNNTSTYWCGKHVIFWLPCVILTKTASVVLGNIFSLLTKYKTIQLCPRYFTGMLFRVFLDILLSLSGICISYGPNIL